MSATRGLLLLSSRGFGGKNGLDFDDIDDFVRILNNAIGGGMTMARMFQIIAEVKAVPEPASSSPVLMGCLAIVSFRRGARR
jgi:hypothetical protein